MTERPLWEMAIEWPAGGAQRVYDLAQPLQHGIPHHPVHPPFAFTLTKKHGEVVYGDGVSAASELLTMGGHVGTHVDGLGHVSKDGMVHGHHRITCAQSYTEGIGHGAIDGIAPFLCPGHLVDVPRLLGRPLGTGDRITGEMLGGWFGDAAPAAGSVVLVRTGWDELWLDTGSFMGRDGHAPGVDLSGAQWLSACGVRATGSDTIAYEKMPSPELDVHVHLLVEHGIHIIEALNLAELARDAVRDFFFIAAPLKIRGGTGSPIRPLAVVAGEPGRNGGSG